jgi:lipid II:glycine glycyltransferase (peptidoglycan interpeptide bridge formation enzyme)
MDLSKDLDTIWNGFRGSVRTAIRKAEKARLSVENNTDEEGLNKFYSIYSTLVLNGKGQIHSYDFFYQLWKRLQPKSQISIFNVMLDGKPVATEFVLIYGKTAEQAWTANLRLNNDPGASQLMQWHVMRWLKEKGALSYNLGGVPINKDRLSGVRFFKESFGGDFVQFLGEYELPKNRIVYYLWKKLSKFYLNRWRFFARKK